MISMDFILGFVRGEKKLFSAREIVPFKMARFNEFKLEAVLSLIEKDDMLKKYVPDEWLLKKRGSREYCWAIVATRGKDYCERILGHAIKER